MATILIADDRPMNRQYLITLLGYFGHRLLEASNGEEALQLAKSEHPGLVISDLMMPIVDGQELAIRMQHDPELAKIPILFYSANYSLPQAKAVAHQVGAIDVLPKPGDPETILGMVHSALGLPVETREIADSSKVDSSEQGSIPREFAELQALAQRLAAPIEMSLELAAERDPARLLLGLAYIGRELIGARYSAIGISSADRQSERIFVTGGSGGPATWERLARPFAGADPSSTPAPPPDSILGKVLTESRPVRLSKVNTADLHFQFADCSILDSLLAVPLLAGKVPRGWFLLADKLGSDDFTDGDLRVMAALALQGTLAFERVQEQLRGEEALRKSQATFEALFEAAPDAMIASDETGLIRSANAQTEHMFGYSPRELVGQPIEILMPERFRGGHAGLRQGYYRQSRLRSMGAGLDLYGRRKDSTEFPVDIMLSPLEASDGKLVVSVIRDITRRKETEARILELNRNLHKRVEELQTANQSLETFSYSVSHDLRAPLRAIDGFARIITEDYGPILDQEAQRLLELIADNCHKMGSLIEDLLSFARAGRGIVLRSEIDMTRLAWAVVEEFRTNEPRQEVHVIVGTLPPALGERSMVRQVLTNLISNAWKFTRRTPGATIEIGASHNGEPTVYYVKDNGVGFDPAYSNKLFGVFERLHKGKDFEGTGIGLALVHRIIQNHNGRVWATGKVGEGATFFFTLDGTGGGPGGRHATG